MVRDDAGGKRNTVYRKPQPATSAADWDDSLSEG